jgi:hypothetical protein
VERVFVIHGHDLEAREELVKLLRTVGADWLSFEDVAISLPGSPYIADVVLEGIRRAKAVVALFTPDEHAVRHQPATPRYLGDQRSGSRWQARPNVMFEAGIAQGIARERMLVVTIGKDVELFPDVGGVHFVRLDEEGGKRLFAHRLAAMLDIQPPPDIDIESPESGDFIRVRRTRWTDHDELAHLEKVLSDEHVGAPPVTLLEVLQAAAAATTSVDWSRRKPIQFMEAVRELWPSGLVPSRSAWWFIVHGLFEFKDIDDWLGEDWRTTLDRTVISLRGLRLIQKWQLIATTK